MKNIFDYIEGDLHGRDAHNTELEALRDPFLSDAMEGYSSVKGDHRRRVELMSRHIEKKKNVRRLNQHIWIVVACFLVLLFAIIGWWLVYRSDKTQKQIPQHPPTEQQYPIASNANSDANGSFF